MNESLPHALTARPAAPVHPAGPPKPTAGVPTLGMPHDDLSSLSLVDAPPTAAAPSKIRAFNVPGMVAEPEYKRHANLTGACAVHMKTFHGRLSDDGIARLDHKVNEWLEAHPQCEVKFATTNIGLWDGKTKDMEMIINVWY